MQPKGEALAWGVFAGIAFFGWLGTLLIRGHGLESEDYDESSDDEEGDGDLER